MTRRQVPRWSELRDLVKLQRPELSPTRRHLAAALTVADPVSYTHLTLPTSDLV